MSSDLQTASGVTPKMELQRELVKQLLVLMRGGQAHVDLARAVAGLPAELRGVRPEHVPYSARQLAEHLRIAQRDILDSARTRMVRGTDIWHGPKRTGRPLQSCRPIMRGMRRWRRLPRMPSNWRPCDLRRMRICSCRLRGVRGRGCCERHFWLRSPMCITSVSWCC